MAGQNSRKPDRTAVIGPRETRQSRPGECPDEAEAALPPWLMREKIAVPDRVTGYLHRPELIERMYPADRRGTVLKAPGGFGKTTLLSELCRTARETGVLVAWLTLDLQDAPQILGTYLSYAFREAGLDLQGGASDSVGGPIETGIERLLRAVAAHGGPCLLALDELERIGDPESLALLNTLLKWSPSNLRFAIACRELPPALDIGSSMLSGNVELFDAGHLRFSREEIAGFLGNRLPRRELDALAKESRGWPIALRIVNNEATSRAGLAGVDDRDVAENWIESRLWRDLAAGDRDFLLDVGLFGRMDGDLLDEVLDTTGAIGRLQRLPAVAGLLESVHVDATRTWRLHPLIGEHCQSRRRRETPDRFRSLQCRIAEVLAQRGETVAAMRHAAMAEAHGLTAGILEDAGAMRLWLREGTGRLQSAYRFLTPHISASHPRLALARCVVEMTAGRIAAARKTYAAAVAARPQPESGKAADFQIDECTARGMLCLYGCESMGSATMRATLADYARYADEPAIDSAMRGNFELGLCIACNMKAEFDAALHWADRTERRLGGSRYVRMFVDLYRGQIAMARGQVKEAAGCYGSAHRIARTRVLGAPDQAVFVEVMMRELDWETHRATRLSRATLGIPDALYASGTPVLAYSAASGTSAELTLLRRGHDAALGVLEEAFEYALERELPALVRCLGGMRVYLLSAAGQTGEAEGIWRRAGLPEDDAACLDLEGQTWRELESLSCARLRLLLATGRFDAGRRFADSLFTVVAQRGLRRTWMRGLAVAVAIERAANQEQQSIGRLVEFLHHYAETNYAAGAVLERLTFVPALEEVLASRPAPGTRKPAERLLETLRGVDGALAPDVRLSTRELEILEQIGTMPDKEIAKALGLTVPGVRYHVAKIFAKLGVNDRRSAVERARRAGLLPDH